MYIFASHDTDVAKYGVAAVWGWQRRLLGGCLSAGRDGLLGVGAVTSALILPLIGPLRT